MDIKLAVKNPTLFSYRLTLILGALLAVGLAVSLLVFGLTEQWMKRTIFFPEVNSKKYEAEVRYLPATGSSAGDIRALLDDMLLGPSNFGYTDILPVKTRLAAVTLEKNILYAGFDGGIYQLDNTSFAPRAMLQAVADTLYFNFPWLENIYFFVDGQQVGDLPLKHRNERLFDLARMLVPHLGDLGDTLRYVQDNALFSEALQQQHLYSFQNGARWDERILK